MTFFSKFVDCSFSILPELRFGLVAKSRTSFCFEVKCKGVNRQGGIEMGVYFKKSSRMHVQDSLSRFIGRSTLRVDNKMLCSKIANFLNATIVQYSADIIHCMFIRILVQCRTCPAQ